MNESPITFIINALTFVYSGVMFYVKRPEMGQERANPGRLATASLIGGKGMTQTLKLAVQVIVFDTVMAALAAFIWLKQRELV